MNGIKLRGTGRCVPANTVTNDDLSRLVDTNDEWIMTRIGCLLYTSDAADE